MKKQFWIPITAVVMLAVASASAFADLTAAQIVSHFNSQNGNTGLNFTYTANTTGYTGSLFYHGPFTSTGQQVDISGYTPYYVSVAARGGVNGSGQNYFMSLCVEPNVTNTAPSSGTARLNYNASTGQTQTSSGVYLSVGGAFLYRLFAQGILNENANQELAKAIHLLNSAAQGTDVITGSTNVFLLNLLNYNSSNRSFWTQNYSALTDYSSLVRNNTGTIVGMGEYYVYVLTTNNGATFQDSLYIANRTTYNDDGFNDVPEPATLLIWSLGGMGLVGSWVRKRRMKKSALS
jgi:hypothetical protein